ncbi:conserved hypothetical protein [Ricinus communis]|uniref:Uncharacterized protein n=1 Tax=Ricinus communis TaxID=3988 RepID=B9T976_RICCO|nr:conserved hypothetical protein [Ricinus communis]
MGSGERAASGVGLARLISLGRGGLDHFPAVAGGVAETGIDAAEALHRLLDELDSPCLQLRITRAAVSHRKHEGRHGALRNHGAQRLSRGLVMHGRAGRKQAELERRLFRMLHREPPIRAVAHVRMDAKSELVDIERERFVLIVDIQPHYVDSLVHFDISSIGGRNVPFALRRRFSKTAVVRSGRCAAFRMHAGTWASWRPLARASTRIAPGLRPVTSRNVRPNVPRLSQPVAKAISVMVSPVSRSSVVACSMRRVSRYRCGGTPKARLKQRAKWP